MRISEERLSKVLTRGDHGRGLIERNPVAALIVEAMAAAHLKHGDEVKAAGALFCDLVGANEDDATRLSLPVAIQVLNRDEAVPVGRMRAHLAELAGRDLLLGMSVHALFGGSGIGKRRRHHRDRDAVVRTIYLLVRMFEAQEEADELERAVGLGEPSEEPSPSPSPPGPD